MAALIRVGNTFVNLDRVQHILISEAGTSVYFSAKEGDWVRFRGREGEALAAYLDDVAPDVVSLQLATEAEERRWNELESRGES
jgi:hypothetical protein